VLPEVALQSLGTTPEILDMLQHPQLQTTITNILDPNSSETLDEALKTNPDFVAFVDKMLRTVGARDSNGVFSM